MKNITLSIPEDLLEKSRAYAKERGTSLNALVRELLRRYVMTEPRHPIDQLLEDSEQIQISTASWRWNRDELYDRQVFS
jgi:plasmid stability protein